MQHQSSKRASGTLIVTVILTCFGSSLLYGYNLAIVNLPSSHIICFLNRTMLDGGCGKPENNWTNTINASSASRSMLTGSVLFAFSNTLFVLFGAIGAFSIGWMADIVGRRNGLLLNNVLGIVAALLYGLTVILDAPILFLLARLCIGINCGITIGLASMYLIEISPRSLRGTIGACHQLAVTIGIVTAYLLTLTVTLNTETLWLVACALTGIPAFTALVLMLLLCPESPRYTYMKHQLKDQAKRDFKRLNPWESVDKFIEELDVELSAAKLQSAFHIRQLFTDSQFRLPTMLSCLLQVMQQLSGINAVISYSSLMISTTGIQQEYLQYCVVAIGVVNVICTVISLPLLERLGRRTLLLWSSMILLVSLIVLTASVNMADPERGWTTQSVQFIAAIVSVAFIFAYVIGFAFGLGPLPSLLVAELFRQESRGAAYSVSQLLQWMCNLLILATFPITNDAIGGFSFLPYAVVVTVCWLVFYKYMPETRGKTIDDIARGLSAKHDGNAEADSVAMTTVESIK